MLEWIASIFGYLMNYIYGIVQNYGLAIIIFTALVKILLLPLSIKQQKSMEVAQKMQPQIQELQRKYGNDQQKLSEEYQKLMKSSNTSMFSGMGCSGCLINLVQLPIILGMFYMMVNPLKYILKIDVEEIEKYKEEVNAKRKNAAIEAIKASGDEYTDEELELMIKNAEKASYVDNRYYEIDIIEDRKLLDMNFLGINLCDIANKHKDNYLLLIIPILSGAFTYLSLFITNLINKKNTGKSYKQQMDESEVPMPDMRVMNIMMPIMTGYVAYIVPQGVGLYWAVNNLLGIVQLLAFKKFLGNNGTSQKKDNNEIKLIEGPLVDEKLDINNDASVIDEDKKTNNNKKNHKKK